LSSIGKIIRIDRNGAAVSGNPWPNDLNGVIWSKGHRNPCGLAFTRTNPPKLWETEQGEEGGDEMNLIETGKDYGWGAVGYGWEYGWRYGDFWGAQGWWANQNTTRKPNTPIGGGNHAVKGFVEPKFIWPVNPPFISAVTGPGQSIAVSQLICYSGQVFGQWAGNLFVSALSGGGGLWRLTLNSAGDSITSSQALHTLAPFTDLGRRTRNVIEGPNGFIYVFTEGLSGNSGKIYVIKP
jgi:glucose/arabinose dehydrogenase